MTLIITDDDVRRLFSMSECIEAMRVAFGDFAKGEAVNRPRMRYVAKHPDPAMRYFANVHIGAVPSYGIACVRAGSTILRPATPDNPFRTYESPTQFNWGIVILYSVETAEPLALLHEFYLSGVRVGATTAMAIDQMARPDAATLGLFGTGKQAATALEAIACVRPIARVNVYSPNPEHLRDFVARMNAMNFRPGLAVVAAADARAVVAGADVVCCATNAMSPLFDGDWLEDGQIVVTIANSDVTNKRSEVDRRTFERASAIVVNDWESVVDNGQTELLDPIAEGAVDRANVHELGDVVLGKAEVTQPPRGAKAKGIIYFKNNSGLAIQFAAAGGVLYRKALAQGVDKSIPREWLGTDLSPLLAAGFRPSP
ncbi:MAG TPA: ornithine cyclodeaminase family protein [Alphaproteobacteria bacterium]|jgi:ornithine cyclodeaminase/alanine dehydrogenase-like protein (mu-crystallin family)